MSNLALVLNALKVFSAKSSGKSVSEGQKGTPGRGRDRKCHDRASLSHPLVLSLLTSLTSFPLFCTSEDINGMGWGGPLTKWGWRGRGRFVMTFSDVFLPVPFFREGANREKLTVKKRSSITIFFFFTVFVPYRP